MVDDMGSEECPRVKIRCFAYAKGEVNYAKVITLLKDATLEIHEETCYIE